MYDTLGDTGIELSTVKDRTYSDDRATTTSTDTSLGHMMGNTKSIGIENMTWEQYLRQCVDALILDSKLNILLVCVPLAFLSVGADLGEGAIFGFSLLGLIPLAAMLGFITEQLALCTNETLGGLLNATFGNATELIISIIALNDNQIRLVQLSLIGSILSNLLLVLGCAFFVGGLRFKVQSFNVHAATTNGGLLLLATLCLLTPAFLEVTHGTDEKSELSLSRFTSFLMLGVYAAYITFQLATHRHLFDPPEPEPEPIADEEANSVDPATVPIEEEDEEEEVLGYKGGLVCLFVVTVLIAFLSEYLVDAIDGAAESWGMTKLFIGVILIPIVGNAAEHATAVTVAYRNKMDLSLGVAVGSAVQIALFVIPLMVVVSWLMGKDLSLYFQMFETVCVFSTVLIVCYVLNTGTSNWIEGLVLLVAYIVISAAFFYHDDYEEEDP
eukprot:Rmarinus@m.4814